MTGRKNTLEGGLRPLQAGKQQLEMIKFRSSGDTNVTAGQPTWKINIAGHCENDFSICFPLREWTRLHYRHWAWQMRPWALLRQIYQSFLLLEMSKLLAGPVTFVLCTLTVEEQEHHPLSSVRPAEQARLMHGEHFYVEQHTTWEAKSSQAKLSGTWAVPLPMPKLAWLLL